MQFEFDGEPEPLPEPLPRRTAKYMPASASDPGRAPRHVGGYQRFVAIARTRVMPAPIGLPAAIEAIRASADEIRRDPELLGEAAIFLGNTLIHLEPAASWRHIVAGRPAIWKGARGVDLKACVRRIIAGEDVFPALETFEHS